MDDLDRLAFRLVRRARESFPQFVTHGFSLADVEERLLPFTEARREMAENSSGAWETTVLRLMSGERGYLLPDQAFREACLRALSHPSPALSLIRGVSPATLRLGQKSFPASDPSALDSGASGRRGSTVKATRNENAERSLPRRGCRYCGGRLPEGRIVHFCPHCGSDLTKRQCPACSTELELGWRFCVTCGRRSNEADQELELRLTARAASG